MVSKTYNQFISLNFILLFMVFTFAWYIYISSSVVFEAIINIGNHIAQTIFSDFLDPESSRGAFLITKQMPSFLWQIFKIIHLVVQFFIIIGIFKSLIHYKDFKFKKEYMGFSLYWFGICLIAIAVSGFAAMSPGRLYHLSLFLLSPFSVIGGITIFQLVLGTLKVNDVEKKHRYSLNIFSIFLAIYLLINSGFLFEVMHDHPYSISLSQEKINDYGSIDDVGSLYTTIIPVYDVYSSEWLSKNRNVSKRIYATLGHGEGKAVLMVYGNIPSPDLHYMDTNITIRDDSYIYLYYLNVIKNIGSGYNKDLGYPTYFNISEISQHFEHTNKIYNNGGSNILHSI